MAVCLRLEAVILTNKGSKAMQKTIVMVHGMWCGDWVWENYRGFFEKKGYNCITPILRHHDVEPHEKPDPKLGLVSLKDYVDDLEKEIKALDHKPIIMGHSMGGLLTQMLAARSLASAIVLLTSASPAGIMALRPTVVKSFWSVLTKWGFWKTPMRLTFKEADYSMLGQLSPEKKKEVYEKLVFESGRAAAEIGFWYIDPNQVSGVDESKVTCPVTVICGTMDKVTPVSVARQIAKKYKVDAAYREYDNHAHWLLDEPGWEKIAEDISGWLDNV